MKIKNVLVAFVFMTAIGSAVASEFFAPVPAYSRKTDVPGQVDDCVQRGTCDGTLNACIISFDHDVNPLTPNISRQMYSANTGTSCGVELKRN